MTTHSKTKMRNPCPVLRSAFVAAGLSIGLAAGAFAQAARAQGLSYALQPGSALWITGDSTLHAWGSTATKVELAATFDSAKAVSADSVAKGGLKALSLTLLVKGLKSGEAGLDKNMYKALKEPRAPVIAFTLLDYSTAAAKDGSVRIRARGKLSIAGQTKETVIEGACSFSADGLSVSGSHELLMTDFGITPPTLMLGTIKVANKIVVHYDLKLKASSNATPQK
jgi:polyisoprenoid-binding protein YceI